MLEPCGAGALWCWSPVVLEPCGAGALRCWSPVVLGPCGAGTLRCCGAGALWCWGPVVLGPCGAGALWCWGPAVLGPCGAGALWCWSPAVPTWALTLLSRGPYTIPGGRPGCHRLARLSVLPAATAEHTRQCIHQGPCCCDAAGVVCCRSNRGSTPALQPSRAGEVAAACDGLATA